MKNTFITIMLTALFLLFLPCSDKADAAESEFVCVMGNEITDGQYLTTDGEILTVDPGAGYAYYKDGVLTLNDYVASGSGHDYPDGYFSNIYADNDLNIVLIGENSLVQTRTDSGYITSKSGNIYIDDTNGTLSLSTTADPLYNIGIYAINGDVILGSTALNGKGITIEAYTYCVSAKGNVVINDNIVAKSYDEELNDVNHCIKSSGTVTVAGQNIELSSNNGSGIYAPYVYITSEDKTNLPSVSINSYNYSIYCKDVTINGDLIAYGGIYADGTVTMLGYSDTYAADVYLDTYSKYSNGAAEYTCWAVDVYIGEYVNLDIYSVGHGIWSDSVEIYNTGDININCVQEGIKVYKELTIDGSGDITIVSAKDNALTGEYSSSLGVTPKISVVTSGDISLTSGHNNFDCIQIDKGSLYIAPSKKGSVTLTASNDSGIQAIGADVTLDGEGKIKIVGGPIGGCIYVSDADLQILGSTLTCESTNYAIMNSTGNIIIDSDYDVTVTAENGYAIAVYKDITLAGTGEFNISSDSSEGIYSRVGDMYLATSGIVDVEGLYGVNLEAGTLYVYDSNDTVFRTISSGEYAMNAKVDLTKSVYVIEIEASLNSNGKPIVDWVEADNETYNYISFTATTATTTEYTSGATYQAYLIEPWALRTTVRFRDASGNDLDVSDFADYGVYAIREGLLNGTDSVTISDIIVNQNTIHFSPSDVQGEGAFVYEDGRMTFDFNKEVYTYRLSENIYWVAYVVDSDGNVHYTKLRTKSLHDVAEQLVAETSTDSYIKAILEDMLVLEEAIVDYRSDFENLTDLEPSNPSTVQNCGINFGLASSDGKYAIGNSYRISLIEPWSIRLIARIYDTTDEDTSSTDHIDYSTADDYGIIVFQDIDGTHGNMSNYADLLAIEDAYVYSKSQGNMGIDSDDSTKVSAGYDKDIFTYQLDKNVYCVSFVEIDGQFYYSKLLTRNMHTFMTDSLANNSGTEKLLKVYDAMIEMYESVQAYHESL